MTFEQYWTILIKQWKLVVICFLLVGLGAFIGSKLMKPLYQSSVLVQVVIRSGSSNPADIQNLDASAQLLQTEVTLSVSSPVLQEVATHFSGVTAGLLAGEVTATSKTNTQIFEIDVVDLSPARAAAIANEVASTLIKQQIQAVQNDDSQSRQEIQQSLDQTQMQIDAISTQIAALQQVKGSNQGQITHLQGQLNGLQQQYSQLENDLAQLEVTQVQSENFLRVVQPALPSSSPVRPNTMLNTGGGLLVGLLLGILLALLYDRLDTRVRTPIELAQLLEWPILATIWHANSSNATDMISPTGNNVNIEPYRILRTNIGFSSLDKPLHSLVVTSALPRDGKSTIAANLAIFMARAGKSTLLVDADLRQPVQHTNFNLPPNTLGLSNAVLAFSTPEVPRAPSYHQFIPNTSNVQSQARPTTSSPSLEPFVHSIRSVPNLWVMPSGPLPPNSSEFLESKVMQRFLGIIANSGAEIVIFDTPPLLGLSDASILASKVDGALVVVDTRRARKEKLKQMKAVLSKTGVHVLGCVVNKLQSKSNDSTYYYFTEDQDSVEKSISNGHTPPVANAPTLAESSYEQRIRSN